MSGLPTKADFLAHGLAACPVPDEDPDCPICQEQFTSAPSTPSDATESNSMSLTDGATEEDAESHVPMQMPCCNNVFCHHCITTWLNFVTTCPTCRVQLFERLEPEPESSEPSESETFDYEEEFYEEDLDVLMEFDTD
ncbi:hypothetical protein BM1_02022 [Bipolaris maydis]|nr:hypothetical protein BM1_02022 [Bipolaris maydis]